MNNDDKKISIGLAKQIDAEHKRLGITPPESEWCFASNLTPTKNHHYLLINRDKRGEYPNIFNHTIPAYDTAELLSFYTTEQKDG